MQKTNLLDHLNVYDEERVLVIAPRQAGKTKLAHRTILQSLSETTPGANSSRGGNCVYVAPSRMMIGDVVRRMANQVGLAVTSKNPSVRSTSRANSCRFLNAGAPIKIPLKNLRASHPPPLLIIDDCAFIPEDKVRMIVDDLMPRSVLCLTTFKKGAWCDPDEWHGAQFHWKAYFTSVVRLDFSDVFETVSEMKEAYETFSNMGRREEFLEQYFQ